ncbi:uncharacterized protein LOC141601116 [Silene latifolia]|uniref:uncharacterized protein LOC141601116 n=1 Tax=Silene latifolia TaxID=37657 RepID=UPI003D779EC6
MRKPELSGRMAKWSVHLSGYDLKFEPRTAIKSQALADFVSDFCPALQTQAEQDILNLEEDKGEQVWELHVDGASNAKGAGVGLVLKHLQVCSDSKLIVNHVNDCYEARDPRMMAYLDVAKELKIRFVTFNIKQIPRDHNAEADALATLGATSKVGTISTIPIVHVLEPATLKYQQKAEVVCSTSSEENTPDWRKPYIDWLQNDILPVDKKEVTETQVISFIKRNIICRFGIPSEIICDNGSQFIGNKTEAFCDRWNVSLQKFTLRNPQSNGQAESSNKIIIENLKKKLEEIGGKWAEELPLVLLANRTIPKVATGQTPFSLVFGAEAVIPSEVRVPTHIYGCITEYRNEVEMASNLDTIDELRTNAQMKMASYRQTVARSYNRNVKVRTLQVGDLVLRKVFQNTKNQQAGKFAYNWERPYQVESAIGNGAYRLMTLDG